MLAQVCGMQVGELVHVIADAHIYDRHIPLVEELITRETASGAEILAESGDYRFLSVYTG